MIDLTAVVKVNEAHIAEKQSNIEYCYLKNIQSSIDALLEGVCFTIQFLAVQCSKSSSRHQESRAKCYSVTHMALPFLKDHSPAY